MTQDFSFRMPDEYLDLTESERYERLAFRGAFLRDSRSDQFYMRVLLALQVVELEKVVYGCWMRVSKDEIVLANDVWDKPEYLRTTFAGSLANDIEDVDHSVLGTDIGARANTPEELPYVFFVADSMLGTMLRL